MLHITVDVETKIRLNDRKSHHKIVVHCLACRITVCNLNVAHLAIYRCTPNGRTNERGQTHLQWKWWHLFCLDWPCPSCTTIILFLLKYANWLGHNNRSAICNLWIKLSLTELHYIVFYLGHIYQDPSWLDFATKFHYFHRKKYFFSIYSDRKFVVCIYFFLIWFGFIKLSQFVTVICICL